MAPDPEATARAQAVACRAMGTLLVMLALLLPVATFVLEGALAERTGVTDMGAVEFVVLVIAAALLAVGLPALLYGVWRLADVDDPPPQPTPAEAGEPSAR